MTKTKKIAIINGPNLNLLGTREKEIYGLKDLKFLEKECIKKGKEFKIAINCFQSNIEGEIINEIQKCRGYFAIIINPAGYTHTSIAILDALKAIDVPVYEVHISNIYSREPYRHYSYISSYAKAVISGCGINGYLYAIMQAAEDLL